MAKIVYNACYGGFGLSIEGMNAYATAKGFKLFHYIQTKYKHSSGSDEYVRYTGKEGKSCIYSLKSDLGDLFNEFPENAEWFSAREIPRNDADLARIVEKLGEAASGMYAALKIAHVADGTPYRIDEYDGNESVETPGSYDWQLA
jgi:hypothetical protein